MSRLRDGGVYLPEAEASLWELSGRVVKAKRWITGCFLLFWGLCLRSYGAVVALGDG